MQKIFLVHQESFFDEILTAVEPDKKDEKVKNLFHSQGREEKSFFFENLFIYQQPPEEGDWALHKTYTFTKSVFRWKLVYYAPETWLIPSS